MDWIDLAVIAYIVIGAFSGLRRGLILVLFSLAGYVVGVALAAHYQKAATAMLMTSLPVGKWTAHLLPAPATHIPGAHLEALNLAHVIVGLLVFLLIIGATEFVGRLIGEVITRLIGSFKVTGMLNKVGGGLAGLAEHGVVVGIVLTIVLALPMIAHSPISRELHRAPLAMLFVGWFGHISRMGGGFFL